MCSDENRHDCCSRPLSSLKGRLTNNHKINIHFFNDQFYEGKVKGALNVGVRD